MKLHGINPDNTKRVELDGILRAHIEKALSREEVSAEEIVFLLVRAAVECEGDGSLDKGFVMGSLVGAYTLRGMPLEEVTAHLQSMFAGEKRG